MQYWGQKRNVLSLQLHCSDFHNISWNLHVLGLSVDGSAPLKYDLHVTHCNKSLSTFAQPYREQIGGDNHTGFANQFKA